MPKHNQQEILQKKFAQYLGLRKTKNPHQQYDENLPFENNAGWCSGLVAYWLYLKKIGKENDFLNDIEYILNWDPKQYLNSDQDEDKIFERFFNDVLFLHHDKELRHTDRQNIAESINLLLGDGQTKVDTLKYSSTFVFNRTALSEIITKNAKPNNMVRFGNAFHTIGLMYEPPIYYIYDPSSEAIVKCTSADEAANLIFTGLAVFCKSTDYIALNMSVFDLENNSSQFPDSKQERLNLLENPTYKQAVLHHPNILRVCMRYHDHDILKTLEDHGYKYVKSNLYIDNELGDAVANQEPDDLKYLLQHGLHLNYRNQIGETALGAAIMHKQTDFLYKLLQMGVNPNVPVAEKISALDWCLIHKNTEAMILLLAAGAHCSNKFLAKIHSRYKPERVQQILEQAAILSHKFAHANQTTIEKLSITSKSIIDLLSAASKEILSKPLAQWSDKDQAAIATILGTLTEITESKTCFNPIKLYLNFRANQIKHRIEKYLKNQGYSSIPAYLTSLNSPTGPMIFSALTNPPAAELQYERDILPLLKLR